MCVGKVMCAARSFGFGVAPLHEKLQHLEHYQVHPNDHQQRSKKTCIASRRSYMQQEGLELLLQHLQN